MLAEIKTGTKMSAEIKTDIISVTRVNIQDFLLVFQGSGIGKMEDNLTSADPLSYTTNESGVDLGSLVSGNKTNSKYPKNKRLK